MYTDEYNVLMLIALLKRYGIKYIIACPGSANANFIASIQDDKDFKIFSCIDERSACYMACGMASELNEPIVVCCTGATAPRNFLSGLTEAYYRNLPVLAIMATESLHYAGHNIPQTTERNNFIKDVSVYQTVISKIRNKEDLNFTNVAINQGLINLTSNQSGPVIFHLEINKNANFSKEKLPDVRLIKKIKYGQTFPTIDNVNTIVIFIGNHKIFNKNEIINIEKFCETYNAVVYCDNTSNYQGKYSVQFGLISSQFSESRFKNVDLLIHIGNTSGAYFDIHPKKVWRVDPDGKLIDTYRSLEYVFAMKEGDFFKSYIQNDNKEITKRSSNYKCIKNEYDNIYKSIPSLPFSNIWINKILSKKLPKYSILHFAILNSLKSSNFFEFDKTIEKYCNTGGFGIDGCLSTAIGSSLVCDKIHFLIIGDLAFYYDINALGNRHIGNNLRILLINNNGGATFKTYDHRVSSFGSKTDKYIAACDHFKTNGNSVAKNFANNLGFDYLQASNKSEFKQNLPSFLNTKVDNSIVFEVLISQKDENEALWKICHIQDSKFNKKNLKEILPSKQLRNIKQLKRDYNKIKATLKYE